jgi:hypothetical protein
MKEKTGKLIEIDNIHLAAYLIAKRCSLSKVTRSGRMGVFHFDSINATPEIQAYMAGEALIEPKDFVSAIRQLKMRIDECPPEFAKTTFSQKAR